MLGAALDAENTCAKYDRGENEARKMRRFCQRVQSHSLGELELTPSFVMWLGAPPLSTHTLLPISAHRNSK